MRSILETGKNAWKTLRADSAGVLIDGLDYYRAFHKAASAAKKSILISGWQFDSSVRLLRGHEEKEKADGGDSRLLPFLNSLCEKKPELRIYVLAWDFSLFFIPDHELAQELVFNWSTSERLEFIFDKTNAAGASHHQKLIVIDCNLAFIGGLDICSSHWDDREHRAFNPHRKDINGSYGPYHDAVCWLKGDEVSSLAEYFRERWTRAGGEKFELSCVRVPEISFEGGLTLPPGVAAVSRTQGKTLDPPRDQVQEIKQLYTDAIAAAEKFIYIENQYFTSAEIYRAIVERMRERERPGLQVIIVLPRKFNAFLEEILLGLAQTKMLTLLSEAADASSVKLGIYYSSSKAEDTAKGAYAYTYIHSKIMIVDDRFLTIGSANASNRSMSLDTELNASWEGQHGDTELKEAIRRIRTDLLAEHAGINGTPEAGRLYGEDEIVDTLDTLADSGKYRIHRHAKETLFDQYRWIKGITPEDFAFDPAEPIIAEELWESIFSKRGGILSGTADLFSASSSAPSTPPAAPPAAPAEPPGEAGRHGRLDALRDLHPGWMALLAVLALSGLLLWFFVIK
jgi:phospholipase D1/2